MILFKVTTIMTQTSRIRDLNQKHLTYKVEKDTQFLNKKDSWGVPADFKMIVKYRLLQQLRLAEKFVKQDLFVSEKEEKWCTVKLWNDQRREPSHVQDVTSFWSARTPLDDNETVWASS